MSFGRFGSSFGLVVLGLGLAWGLASCGGSSSETPPPLEPSPANVHYSRSATTLPGELGTPTRAAPAPSPTSTPKPTPFHPSKAPSGSPGLPQY